MQKHEDLPLVTVKSVRMTRITGWATHCEECDGTTLSKSKKMAYNTAVAHARAAHGGQARINIQ